MAKDDMHLIIYKILRYLYDCNKHGKVPVFTDLLQAIELPMIPQSYLAQILRELVDNGLIVGCHLTTTKDSTIICLSDTAQVTMKGVDYLAENSRMKKAAEVAGRAFELLLGVIISAAMPI